MARRGDYGRVLPTRQWSGRAPLPWWRRLLRAWKPWLLVALIALGWYAIDRIWLTEPVRPKGTPLAVAPAFHRCGAGRGPNCVVDGDTLVIGARRIRLIGIDAPEIGQHARCPQEARMAEEAAAALLTLVNAAPFTMQPPQDGLRDEYGRELMHLWRQRADGTREDFATTLIASGKVREYRFGPRQGWCD